jgi:hypothetical protein
MTEKQESRHFFTSQPWQAAIEDTQLSEQLCEAKDSNLNVIHSSSTDWRLGIDTSRSPVTWALYRSAISQSYEMGIFSEAEELTILTSLEVQAAGKKGIKVYLYTSDLHWLASYVK